MHRLQLHYTLGRASGPALVRNPLIDLLQAVATQGSISAAARALDLSYRHVWGELKRWEDELGNGLVTWEKGQAARLTPFGDKLMWAERQAQVRLAPQIEALRGRPRACLCGRLRRKRACADLVRQPRQRPGKRCANTRWHWARRSRRTMTRTGRCIWTSGFAAAWMRSARSTKGAARWPAFIRCRHRRQGRWPNAPTSRCCVLGSTRSSGSRSVCRAWSWHPAIRWACQRLQDLASTRARFVNRALGTGTRLLLAELMQQCGMTEADICGFERTEPSHAAVAHAVADGSADFGLGIEVAARQLQGLDFVRLASESYHLVCLRSRRWSNQPRRPCALCCAAPAWQQQLTGNGRLPAATLRRGVAAARSAAVVAVHKAQDRKPAKAGRSHCGSWKFLKRGCFMRSRVANEAPRKTLWVPKQDCEYSRHGSATKPGYGRAVLPVHSHTSPQRNPRRLSAWAAISHSTSAGRRRPAQRHQASASHQLTWVAGWPPSMRRGAEAVLHHGAAGNADLLYIAWRPATRVEPSAPALGCNHCHPSGATARPVVSAIVDELDNLGPIHDLRIDLELGHCHRVLRTFVVEHESAAVDTAHAPGPGRNQQRRTRRAADQESRCPAARPAPAP